VNPVTASAGSGYAERPWTGRIAVRMESSLQQAERHVREGEERVARQAALVQRLFARGLDPAGAEAILESLRASLELSREHLRREYAALGRQS
jgi:hypothetical protein